MINKFLLLLLPVITPKLLSAQRFSGTHNYGRDICCFSQVDWEINCQVDFKTEGGGSVWLNFPSWKMSVANAKFQQSGKQYSPSDLGLSQWPDLYADYTTDYIKVDLNISYNGKLVKSIPYAQLTSHGIRLADGYVQGNGKSILYFGDNGIPKEEFKVSQLSVSLTNFSNAGVSPGYEQLSQLVAKKEYGSASNNNASSSSQSITVGGPTKQNVVSEVNSSNKSTASPSNYPTSAFYSEETAVLVGKTIEASIVLLDGIAANAREKRKIKVAEKLEEAKNKTKTLNIEDCNTSECNEEKGDIYKDAAYDGYKSLSATMRDQYLPEIWRLADEYYTKAASQGSASAMKKLIYVYGTSSVRSEQLQKYWVKKLLETYESKAKDGHTASMYFLAQVYDNWENGFHKDYEDNSKAIYWYGKAADNNNLDAQVRLVDVFKNGRMDQTKDYKKAVEYANAIFYNKSATYKQKKKARTDIIDMYKDGGYNIAKNLQLANEWEAKVPDFYENFISTENGWLEVDSKKNTTVVKNGRLLFKSKKENNWVVCTSVECYQDRDFEISSTIRKVEGSETVFFGLLLGSDKKIKNYYALIMSEQGRYGLKRNSDSPSVPISEIPSSLKKGGNFNKLTIRRIGNTYKIYMNEEFVGETPFEKFFGDQFGFIITTDNETFSIEVDDFVIKELRKNDISN